MQCTFKYESWQTHEGHFTLLKDKHLGDAWHTSNSHIMPTRERSARSCQVTWIRRALYTHGVIYLVHPCKIYVFTQRYMYVSVYAHVFMQVHLHKHMCIHMCVLGKYVETCKDIHYVFDIHHVFIIHSSALYIHPCRSHSRSRPRFLSFSLDCSSSRALSVLSSLLLSFYLALYYFGKNTMVWHQAIQRWYREWPKGEREGVKRSTIGNDVFVYTHRAQERERFKVKDRLKRHSLEQSKRKTHTAFNRKRESKIKTHVDRRGLYSNGQIASTSPTNRFGDCAHHCVLLRWAHDCRRAWLARPFIYKWDA